MQFDEPEEKLIKMRADMEDRQKSNGFVTILPDIESESTLGFLVAKLIQVVLYLAPVLFVGLLVSKLLGL